MRRIVLGAAGVAVAVGLVLAIPRFTVSPPVYTVAQVQAGLARDPSAWVGRTVLVRGEVDGGWFGFRLLAARLGGMAGGAVTGVVRHIAAPPIRVGRVVTATISPAIVPNPLRQRQQLVSLAALSLSDTEATVPTKRLPLTLGAPNSILAWLRRLPLVGPALPRPQLLDWGKSAVYRVLIQVAPSQSCGARVCYQAEALDATVGPPAPHWGPVFMVPLSARSAGVVRITSRLTTVRLAPLSVTPAPIAMPHAAP